MSYLNEITKTEEKARSIVEKAKLDAAKTLEKARKDEGVRISESEASLREKATKELSAQKASLAKLYKASVEEGRKEAQALKTASVGRRDRAIKKVISSLSSS